MKFPYYQRQIDTTWKNSIRQRLSQSKHFVKEVSACLLCILHN
jgi:hypothetical protein